jgi:hypothetical protein
MPNQDPTQDPQSIPAHTDLPPLPPDFQNISDAQAPLANQPVSDMGSAAPADLPPMIATPKKKFGGKKIIATILGIFLLVGGVGTGVYLVNQQQTANSKATVWTAFGQTFTNREAYDTAARQASTQGTDVQDQQVVRVLDNAAAQQAAQTSTSNECGGAGQKKCEVVCEGNSCHYGNVSFDKNSAPSGMVCNNITCTWIDVPAGNCQGNSGDCFVDTEIGVGPDGKVCNNSHWTTCANGYSCSNRDCVPPSLITTTSSNPPVSVTTPTASCQSVKAFNETSGSIALTSTELSALAPGSVVTFCAFGTTTAGSFDQAKFTINGVEQPVVNATESSARGSNLCLGYTIPSDGTHTVNVVAQMHHVTLGWVQ